MNWNCQSVNIEIKIISKSFPGTLKGRPCPFFMYVSSFTKNSDDFNILHNDLNVNFDVFAITESCIKKDSSSPVNLDLDNDSIEHTPTETSAGRS